MILSGYQPTVEEVEQTRAGYFNDCKCSPTSVVGGGPAEDGVNAARWDVEVNRALYNGCSRLEASNRLYENLYVMYSIAAMYTYIHIFLTYFNFKN